MSFAGAIGVCFKKYADFRGRASRPEYWYFVLFTVLVAIVTSTIDGVMFGGAIDGPSPFSDVASVILLLPQISAMVRRMRDAGFSAKWLFLLVVPAISVVVTVTTNSSFFTENVAAAPTDEVILQLITLFLPVILLVAAINIFFLVLTIKKSRPSSLTQVEYSAGAD